MSEKTGAEVGVGHVALKFPLDLSIEEAKFIKPNDSLANVRDTIADVKVLVADVKLWPLFSGNVVVENLEVRDAKFNTDGFVSSLRVKGNVERLQLSSRGIDLGHEIADVDGVQLKGGNVDIALLPDTVPEDTTKSDLKWKINIAKVEVDDTRLSFHTIGDTIMVGAHIPNLNIVNTQIDLAAARYSVEQVRLNKGKAHFDQRYEPRVDGLDFNHIALDEIGIELDSLRYEDPNGGLMLRRLSLKEKSGLIVNGLSMPLTLDSLKLSVPMFRLQTPYSELRAECSMDLNAFDELNPGKINITLGADIGKDDIMLFAGMLPKSFADNYPNQPLSLQVSLDGNMRRIEVTEFGASLPQAFNMSAKGYALNPVDMEKMKAQLVMKADFGNLDFVLDMLSPGLRQSYKIPRGITMGGKLSADCQKYAADLTMTEGRGRVMLNGSYNAVNDAYDAKVDVKSLDLRHFMPHDSLKLFSGNVALRGCGFDILSRNTFMHATANITQFGYGHLNIDNVKAVALLEKGVGHAKLNSDNAILDGEISLDALVSTQKLQATLSTDLRWADLQMMRVSEKTLVASMCAHVDVASDLHESHKLQALFNDFTVRTDKKTYRPEDLVVDFLTNRDTTWAKVYSGNLELDFAARGGYEQLMKQGERVIDELELHTNERIIDSERLRALLPVLKLRIASGNDNPVANFLRYNGLDFNSLACNIKSSPVDGLQGHGYIYSLVYDSVRIDTIRFDVNQNDKRVNFSTLIQNNRRNPQFVFKALLGGYVDGNRAGFSAKYYDANDRLGVDAAVMAEMLDSGICVRLNPYRQLLGYKSFNINEGNYVFLARNNRVSAKLDLIADDGTGLKLYSEDDDPEMLQDLTLSLNKFDIGNLSDVMPYMPRVGGLLNGDFRVMIDKDKRISVVSDLAVNSMTYEHCAMGNIGTEVVYLQDEGSAHKVEVRLLQNDREIGILDGTYFDEDKGRLAAKLVLKHTPLDLVNGFVPDQILGLEGFAEGELTVSGALDSPDVNGEIFLDSSYLVSVPYGMRLRFDDDPVRIVGSKLLLENFTMYAHNDNPLNIMGQVDFSNLDKIMVDLKMRAKDYQIIGEKENNKSVAYGKAFVNVDGTIRGVIDNLVMKGKLDVLGKTDMGYILRDSPITTDNQLDELVKFRDFSDTTEIVVSRPQISGFTMDMTLNVSNGAHIMAYLNADHTNYIDLMGGGTLRMQYNTVEGIALNGRYTLNNGKMKYSLPVIPLKTFTIQDGSYIEFHGDVMNPTLNITAEEETKASVSGTNGVGRSVKFVCGIVITKTLQNMGLEFTLDAPEDLTLHNELQNMSVEQRGKLAVTMLTTGMYLADGNTESFSMNNALSSFLNTEINQITGSALRTLDLSIGIDNSTDSKGGTHTDYSFQFAKRFWNNRLKISVGGKVSTGASVQTQQNSSFFDNVTFEYRLDDTANKYVTLFYNNNSYDWLDGYTQEYGAGFIWRKTIHNFRNLFKKDDEVAMPKPEEVVVERVDSAAVKAKEAMTNE
ncbi:MAG: translocation/assembly module TamB domain-containing protein [Prevotella sp.]